MKTIHKFSWATISPSLPTHLTLPDFEVVGVGVQGGLPYFWVLLDPDGEAHSHWLMAVGTGWKIEREVIRVLGMVQDGPFVWHLLEVEAP